MELEFLQIGGYNRKEDYLRHMKEIINVELVKGDTYNDLFKKLESMFQDNLIKQEAVNSWIKLNKDSVDDVNAFNEVLVSKAESGIYASFNLY